MNVAVVGSINMDIVNNVVKPPLPGETIHGKGTAYSPGGKGANQAVAAAKSGALVTMIGAVGNDAFSVELLESLRSNGVNVEHIQKKQTTSGIAFITVAQNGENSIVLSEGANGYVSPEDVTAAESAIKEADVLLLQNEIPWDSTIHAMKVAKKYDVKVILNPAPARKINEEVFGLIDVLVMNETETEEVFGDPVIDVEDAERVGKRITQMGLKSVIITLGSKGSIYIDAGQIIYTPAFSVEVIDTTAAGDTFIAAFSTIDIKKRSIKEALQFATAASAIAVMRQGAQTSIPCKQEIEKWLEGK